MQSSPIKVRQCSPSDPQFLELVGQLDAFLAVTDGEDHSFYNQYNGSNTLDYVVLLEDEACVALACGALRAKEQQRAEVKRMFTVAQARGQRLAEVLLHHLEAEAKKRNFTELVLETGVRQQAAVRLYERMGYKQMAVNYPPYEQMSGSLCFRKELV